MSDALAKVPEVLNFTEEKIIDILSDNHKVLGFFANNDLEEVKRKGEAIFLQLLHQMYIKLNGLF